VNDPTYATREAVKAALDIKQTARSDRQLDEALAAASRTVEGVCHRRFYPQTGTRYFDWPNHQYARPWRLWLDADEVIEVTTLTAGGVEIPSTDYFLRRSDGRDEPPYTHIEIDLDSSSAFSSGGTHQRAVAITGVFGYRADEVDAGVLAGALDAVQANVVVSDASAIGVGDIIRVGTERMVVSGKRMASTGQTLQAPLTASNADVSVAVEDGSAFQPDEMILIDSERMLVVDVAGDGLTVKRSWDGSVLATHTGSPVYALRALSVDRGALGTVAAAHADGADVARHAPPALVRSATMALALNQILQEGSGYARVAGASNIQRIDAGKGKPARERTGRGVADAVEEVYAVHGRKARIRGV